MRAPRSTNRLEQRLHLLSIQRAASRLGPLGSCLEGSLKGGIALKTDAPPLGSKSRKIRLKDNLGLTASVIRNALINYLAGLPRPVLDYDPIRFVSQEDILQACLPADTACPDGLGAHHSCLAQAFSSLNGNCDIGAVFLRDDSLSSHATPENEMSLNRSACQLIDFLSKPLSINGCHQGRGCAGLHCGHQPCTALSATKRRAEESIGHKTFSRVCASHCHIGVGRSIFASRPK